MPKYQSPFVHLAPQEVLQEEMKCFASNTCISTMKPILQYYVGPLGHDRTFTAVVLNSSPLIPDAHPVPDSIL